jgi:hypothetical protein
VLSDELFITQNNKTVSAMDIFLELSQVFATGTDLAGIIRYLGDKFDVEYDHEADPSIISNIGAFMGSMVNVGVLDMAHLDPARSEIDTFMLQRYITLQAIRRRCPQRERQKRRAFQVSSRLN